MRSKSRSGEKRETRKESARAEKWDRESRRFSILLAASRFSFLISLFSLNGSPARHHYLLTGIKVDPVAALQMQVAVKRALPSGERIKGERLRHAHVDSDHPAFDFFAELTRGAPRPGKDRGHVAQRQTI